MRKFEDLGKFEDLKMRRFEDEEMMHDLFNTYQSLNKTVV